MNGSSVPARLHSSRAGGFTLLECMVVMAMFLVTMYAVYAVYDAGVLNYTKGSRKWDVQSRARFALERLAFEIRMAGYAAPSKLPDPVVIATDDTISIHADTDGAGAKYVTYSRRDCTGTVGSTLYRTVSTTAFCGSEALVDGVTALTFSYYELGGVPLPYPVTSPYALDGQAAITGAATPTAPAAGGQRDRVRQVKIALTVQQAGWNDVTVPYTATTDVTLRNLLP